MPLAETWGSGVDILAVDTHCSLVDCRAHFWGIYPRPKSMCEEGHGDKGARVCTCVAGRIAESQRYCRACCRACSVEFVAVHVAQSPCRRGEAARRAWRPGCSYACAPKKTRWSACADPPSEIVCGCRGMRRGMRACPCCPVDVYVYIYIYTYVCMCIQI